MPRIIVTCTMRAGVSDRVLSGKRGGGGEGDAGRQRPESARRQEEESADCYLGDMLTQLNTVMSTKPSEKPSANDGMYRLNAAWYMCEKMYLWLFCNSNGFISTYNA